MEVLQETICFFCDFTLDQTEQTFKYLHLSPIACIFSPCVFFFFSSDVIVMLTFKRQSILNMFRGISSVRSKHNLV